MVVGAVAQDGTHIFRTKVEVAYPFVHTNGFTYQKINFFDNKVLYLISGYYEWSALIVGVNSSNLVEYVKSLSAGSYRMGFEKSAVLSFNGALHFHLVNGSYSGILASMTQLVSNSIISVSTPPFNLT